MARVKAGLRLHQVLLQVKDVERSQEFYTKKLGFKVLYDFSPKYLAVITPNKLQIGLRPFPEGSRRPKSRDRTVGIEFEVDNVDHWYRTLRERRIRFSQKPKDFWGEREARFADPDGYQLNIEPSREVLKAYSVSHDIECAEDNTVGLAWSRPDS
jgi:catechol 2,3-dioxygenase-like lactoylglutathione lyase family enzyme